MQRILFNRDDAFDVLRQGKDQVTIQWFDKPRVDHSCPNMMICFKKGGGAYCFANRAAHGKDQQIVSMVENLRATDGDGQKIRVQIRAGASAARVSKRDGALVRYRSFSSLGAMTTILGMVLRNEMSKSP